MSTPQFIKNLNFTFQQGVVFLGVFSAGCFAWFNLNARTDALTKHAEGADKRMADIEKIVVSINENGTLASRNKLSSEDEKLNRIMRQLDDIESRSRVNMPRFERLDVNVEQLMRERGLAPAPKK